MTITPTQLGTPGNFQLAPVVDTGPDGAFTAVVTEIDGFTFVPSTIILLIDDDGTGDPGFAPTPIIETNPSFAAFNAVKATQNGGAAIVRVGNVANGFPAACDVLVQRYDANGNPIGGEIKVNQAPAFSADVVDIDEGPAGQLSVVYQKIDPGTFAPNAELVRINANGTPSTPVKLGQPVGLKPLNPEVSVNKNGDTIVVYHVETNINGVFDRGDVFGERFAPNGTRIGGPFQVNTTTDGIQSSPSVDDTSDGGFIVTFTNDNTPSGNTEIYGIDFPAPIATIEKTVVANDFATPWTTTTDAGLTTTFNGGPTEIFNQVFIAADPVNPDSTNGVLGVTITEPTGGTLRAEFDDDLVTGGFPSGRQAGDDAIALALRAANDALDMINGDFILEVFDADNPGTQAFEQRVPFLQVTGGPFPNTPLQSSLVADEQLLAAPDQWMDIRITEPLSPENLAILNGIANPVFSYAFEFQSNGPVSFFLNNLRVDLVPIPEPTSAAILALTGLSMARRKKRNA